jgi:tetratricopeptide (TPR) repeat protein
MNRKQRRAAARAKGRTGAAPRRSNGAQGKLRTAREELRAGRLAEAERLLAEILSQHPDQAEALHLLGIVKLQQGDPGAAVELIAKAIAARPDYVAARNDLGNVLARQGRAGEAEAAYRQALERKPDYVQAHNNLGNVLAKQGSLEEAEAAYRRTLELEPDFAEAHNNLGNVLAQQGRSEAALAAYRGALELKPDYAEAYNNLGGVLANRGELEEAEAVYRKMLGVKPESAEAYNNLGNVLAHRGRLGEAMASFERALELNPNHVRAHNNLGLAHQERGEAREAVACFRRALAVEPGYAVARDNLGMALKYAGDFGAAIATARGKLAVDPGDGQAQLDLGTALWQQGEDEGAAAALGEALRLMPERAQVHYQMALVQGGQGARQEALGHLRRALELDPDDLYAQAAEASLMAQEAPPPGAKRVALHMNQRYHHGILRPLFEAARGRHRCLLTADLRTLVEFEPEVVVAAESHAALLRGRLPRALFVSVRHGVISKNTSWYSARIADFYCLTSEASRDEYLRRGGRPRRDFWVTGYVQMDPLFRDAPLPLPLALAAGHKMVLYAPTWNAELSSAPMLGARLVELIRGGRGDLSLVIKPHPVIAARTPEWLTPWRALARSEPDVHLVEDPAADVMPLLKAADVLVSDASSVIFEYLALDRPLVLITNPERHRSAYFDATGIEWRWRDVGEEVRDIEELPAAVARALDDPGRGAERRAHYRELLFGDCTDGRAAERIVDKIGELA